MPKEYRSEDEALATADAEHALPEKGLDHDPDAPTALLTKTSDRTQGAERGKRPAPTSARVERPDRRATIETMFGGDAPEGGPARQEAAGGRRTNAPDARLWQAEDEALARVDAAHALPDPEAEEAAAAGAAEPGDDDTNDPEAQAPADGDRELEEALGELRELGLEEEDLEGLTLAQAQRRITREQKREADFKGLKDRYSAALKDAKAGKPSAEPDLTGKAPGSESGRTDEDDGLDAIIAPFKEALAGEYGDTAIAEKASEAMRGVARTVTERAGKQVEQLGNTVNALIERYEVERLEREYPDRTFDAQTRKLLVDKAEEIAAGWRATGKRAGDPDGGARAAFSEAGRSVLGSGSRAQRPDTSARANGAASKPGGRAATEDNGDAAIRKLSEGAFDDRVLDLIEAGRTDEAKRLQRLRAR